MVVSGSFRTFGFFISLYFFCFLVFLPSFQFCGIGEALGCLGGLLVLLDVLLVSSMKLFFLSKKNEEIEEGRMCKSQHRVLESIQWIC